MALWRCSLFAAILLVLINCLTTRTASGDVTENPIRVGDSYVSHGVSKSGVHGMGGPRVGGPGMGGHRHRQRQQQQWSPPTDGSDVNALYRRSVVLQNSLVAFGLDLGDISFHGNSKDYDNGDNNNSSTRCLVVHRVSLSPKDGEIQWAADRNGRRTVLTLSLHLVEFQITQSDRRRSSGNKTGSNELLTRCAEAFNADGMVSMATSSSTSHPDGTAIFRTTADDGPRRRRDGLTDGAAAVSEDEDYTPHWTSTDSEMAPQMDTGGEDSSLSGGSATWNTATKNVRYGLNKRQILVISTTTTVIVLFCSVAMILRLRNFLKRNNMKYQQANECRRRPLRNDTSSSAQHAQQQKPHQSILELYTIANRPKECRKWYRFVPFRSRDREQL